MFGIHLTNLKSERGNISMTFYFVFDFDFSRKRKFLSISFPFNFSFLFAPAAICHKYRLASIDKFETNRKELSFFIKLFPFFVLSLHLETVSRKIGPMLDICLTFWMTSIFWSGGKRLGRVKRKNKSFHIKIYHVRAEREWKKFNEAEEKVSHTRWASMRICFVVLQVNMRSARVFIYCKGS